jgi:hypothetical protein
MLDSVRIACHESLSSVAARDAVGNSRTELERTLPHGGLFRARSARMRAWTRTPPSRRSPMTTTPERLLRSCGDSPLWTGADREPSVSAMYSTRPSFLALELFLVISVCFLLAAIAPLLHTPWDVVVVTIVVAAYAASSCYRCWWSVRHKPPSPSDMDGHNGRSRAVVTAGLVLMWVSLIAGVIWALVSPESRDTIALLLVAVFLFPGAIGVVNTLCRRHSRLK